MFQFTTGPKKGTAVFEFYNGDKWVSLTKQTNEFLEPKLLKRIFGTVNTMKDFLAIDETPLYLWKYSQAKIKLKRSLGIFFVKEFKSKYKKYKKQWNWYARVFRD